MCRVQMNEGESFSEAVARHSAKCGARTKAALEQPKGKLSSATRRKYDERLSKALYHLYGTGPGCNCFEILKEYYDSK